MTFLDLGLLVPVSPLPLPPTTHPKLTLSTGLGFLDHMVDQIRSHGQFSIGVDFRFSSSSSPSSSSSSSPPPPSPPSISSVNYNTDCQASTFSTVGHLLGSEIKTLLSTISSDSPTSSTFSCPLDESLIKVSKYVGVERRAYSSVRTSCCCCCCCWRVSSVPFCQFISIHFMSLNNHIRIFFSQCTICQFDNQFYSSSLPPYGNRSVLGQTETAHFELFWQSLSNSSGLSLNFEKLRGSNGHHIIEASFKAFSRGLRKLLDERRSEEPGHSQFNFLPSPLRTGQIDRSTNETSVKVSVVLDGGTDGSSAVSTGLATVDEVLLAIAESAEMSLKVSAVGDLWIDDHHTSEDVSIALGQCLNQAIGTKAGLNRMWSCTSGGVECVMDVSNRPFFCMDGILDEGLGQEQEQEQEMVGDLATEMVEHMFGSIVFNAGMSVHMVRTESESETKTNSDLVLDSAKAFGSCLKFCLAVDERRGGGTASSKGTLSV